MSMSHMNAAPTLTSSTLPRSDNAVHEMGGVAGRNNIYAQQVRAFIEAAEMVDTDSETIEDILDGFDGDVYVDDETDGAVDAARTYVEGNTTDLEDAEYSVLLDEANRAWTKADVKQMMAWLKEVGMAAFVNEYVVIKAIPIPTLLYAFGVCLCRELRQKRRKTLMYFLRVALSRELQSREKLPQYNTVDDAAALIRASKRMIILTGAGISVSCGIPDFRSRNGLYATLQESGEYELDDPQQMFDIQYFRENPSVFYSFASQIYPSKFIPSPCHRFIKLIESKGKLLRNYTQNIDTLETATGVQRVLQCHGSFATASCLNCRIRVPGSEIEEDILNQRVPLCKICSATTSEPTLPKAKKLRRKKNGKRRKSNGWESDQSDEIDVPNYPPYIMKPDITFFGEKLNDAFDRAVLEDRHQVDLLLVIGTSLKVSPVSEILANLPHSVPQILINRTPIRHINPDIIMLGNADTIVQYLCHKLHWELPELPGHSNTLEPPKSNLKKRPSEVFDYNEPQRVCDSHVWLFQGAEGGKWVENLEKELQAPLEPESEDESPPEPTVFSEDDTRPNPKKARIQ